MPLLHCFSVCQEMKTSSSHKVKKGLWYQYLWNSQQLCTHSENKADCKMFKDKGYVIVVLILWHGEIIKEISGSYHCYQRNLSGPAFRIAVQSGRDVFSTSTCWNEWASLFLFILMGLEQEKGLHRFCPWSNCEWAHPCQINSHHMRRLIWI